MNGNDYTISNMPIFNQEYNIPRKYNFGRNIYFGNWISISGVLLFYFGDIFQDGLPIINIGKS